MQRRGFIKRLFGVATAVVVSEKLIPDDGVELHSIKHPILLHDAAHHDLTEGFGLAPAKAEGSTMLYDHLNAFDAIRDGVTDKLLGPLETIEVEINE